MLAVDPLCLATGDLVYRVPSSHPIVVFRQQADRAGALQPPGVPPSGAAEATAAAPGAGRAGTAPPAPPTIPGASDRHAFAATPLMPTTSQQQHAATRVASTARPTATATAVSSPRGNAPQSTVAPPSTPGRTPRTTTVAAPVAVASAGLRPGARDQRAFGDLTDIGLNSLFQALQPSPAVPFLLSVAGHVHRPIAVP